MTTSTSPFEKFRVGAAREFAQTMIVIDDEASQSSEPSHTRNVGVLRRPTRRTSAALSSAGATVQGRRSSASGKHLLDAKALIEKSMELGLICSVLKPREGEPFHKKVVKAASIADIVCLDWEIYNDEGSAASAIIRDIIRNDNRRNGRLRLIAVYTGDTTNQKILERVFNSIPDTIRRVQGFRKYQLHIQSESGVRIVCLFKAHGIQLRDTRSENQISEEDLPERLLSEFSTLSGGLLSNVALATAGAIRRSTHHALSKFAGTMDTPYFHHRAKVENPEDAQEYAVDVVLSELGGCIDREGIAKDYAGAAAIEARIQENSRDQEQLTLHFLRNDKPSTYELQRNVSIRMVLEGIGPVLTSENLPNKPGRRAFEEYFSTLFHSGREEARSNMHRFAALTGVRAHPGHHLYKLGIRVATLGLGTIVRAKDRTFLLCLQASCDSVRITQDTSFLFVPLEERDHLPEHVVPVSEKGKPLQFVGLQTSSKTYSKARSICFRGSDITNTINAERIKHRSGFYFRDVDGETYRWVADLKHRRALRTVQSLAQDMGRIGFDEFEPYRR